MCVHQLKALVFEVQRAKKALAFPRTRSLSPARAPADWALFSASKAAWIRMARLGGLAPVVLEYDPPPTHRFAQPNHTDASSTRPTPDRTCDTQASTTTIPITGSQAPAPA